MEKKNISRRTFLKDSAMASAAIIAAPSVVGCKPGKKATPSSRHSSPSANNM